MRRFALAVAVTALFAGTALGQSVVAYELQLGGDNHHGDWINLINTPYTPGDPADWDGLGAGTQIDLETNPGALLDWAVEVTVSGVATADGLETNGAANLVFTLEVREWDEVTGEGALVAAAYLSTMNNGLCEEPRCTFEPEGMPLEMAACCLGYDCPIGPFDGSGGGLGGPGRIFDLPSDSGPYADRVQYPSTSTHPGGHRASGGAHQPATGTPTVDTGTLLGMGAGYSQFYPYDSGGFNTAGIGQDFAFATNCNRGLGIIPVFEGQIDLSALSTGLYILKCIPSEAGNNVIKGSYVCQYPTEPDARAFAQKADQVVPDNVIFSLINGGAEVGITAWASAKAHTGKGELEVALNAGATGTAATADARNLTGGLEKILVDFNGDAVSVNPAAISVTGGASVDASTTLTNGNLTLELYLSGVVAGGHYTIDLTGSLGATIVGDADCEIRYCVGNTNQDNSTSLIDVAQVKSKVGQDPAAAGNANFDVNLDGGISLIDVALTKSKVGAACP